MRGLFIILLVTIMIFSCEQEKFNPIFEVPSESKETKSVIDIKQFLECIKGKKEIPEISNIIKVLEHKKGYKKQYNYIRRAIPHNFEFMLCKKSARKTVPKYLDIEKFAY